MALILRDRIKETTETTGTGTVTLAGAVDGFDPFSAVGDGNTTYYCISRALAPGDEWETGIGTYNSTGTTLERTTVIGSSNGDNLVNFGAGVKEVKCEPPIQRSGWVLDDLDAGAIVFASTGGGLQQEPNYMFFDNATKTIGFGTSTPETHALLFAVESFNGNEPGSHFLSDYLTTSSVVKISSAATTGSFFGETLCLDIARSGSFANMSHTTYGLRSQVTATGGVGSATSTSFAGYFSCTGANTSYGVVIANGKSGSGTATPDTEWQVVGETKMGDDNTNYMTVSNVGDVTFTGGGGLTFAEISVQNNTTADTVSTATWTQVTRFDTNGQNNNMTPDHTNDHITVVSAGMYLAVVSISIDGDPSVDWDFSLYKNNGAGEFTNVHRSVAIYSSGASGELTPVVMTGIVDLAASDTIELWMYQASGSNKSITIADCTLSLVMIGGT